MTATAASGTVSPLRELLERSHQISEKLDLSNYSWWEYAGYDNGAKALKEEYSKLVGIRTQIRASLAAIPPELGDADSGSLPALAKQFDGVETAMEGLERTVVDKTEAARKAHQKLVAAQIVIADPLKKKIDDEVKRVVALDTHRRQFAIDEKYVQDIKSTFDELKKRDVGKVAVPGAADMQSALSEAAKILKQKKLLDAPLRTRLGASDKLPDAFEKAETEEASRKQKEAEAAAARKIQREADIQFVADVRARLDILQALDIGGVVIPGMKEIENDFKSFAKPVQDADAVLTDKQRARFSGLGKLETEYKTAADAETKRKDDEAKAAAELKRQADLEEAKKQQRLELAAAAQKKREDAAKAEEERQKKELADWQQALPKALAEVKKWGDFDEIDAALPILTPLQPYSKDAARFNKLLDAFSSFDMTKPDPEKLATDLAALATLGKSLLPVAQEAIANRADAVTEGVAAVTKALAERGAVLGTDPRRNELKAAMEKYPGLVEEVLEQYRRDNKDTPGQAAKKASQEATAKGEVDKFKRVGGWMDVCGLGGSPRTGPYGPVFMGKASGRIDGFATHVSQFQANAQVPAKGVDATAEEAMDALFGDTGKTTGPHITLERVEKFGSPDNARLFYHSGVFRPGNIPFDQQDAIEAKMREELNKAIGMFKSRIEKEIIKK